MGPLKALGSWWCRTFHRKVSFGGGKYYHCRRCRRTFRVPWAPPQVKEEEKRG
jgi:hypothetical protein